LHPDSTLLIANPGAAGGKVGQRWSDIEARLRQSLGDVPVVHTERVGHATGLALEAVRQGRRTLLSLGGDGTHGDVVGGIIGARAAPGTVTLGVLPAGTGSDFVRLLEGSGELEDQIRRLPSALAHRIDVGRVRYGDGSEVAERYFLNECSCGMSALVCRFVNRSKKRLGGRGSFLLATARAAAAYQPPRIALTLDGRELGTTLLTTAVVSNGRFSGGGMQFAPAARLSDGLLDLTVMSAEPIWRMATELRRLYGGRIASSSSARLLRGKRVRARVVEGNATRLEADGEPLGLLPAEWEVVPGALRLLGARPEVL